MALLAYVHRYGSLDLASTGNTLAKKLNFKGLKSLKIRQSHTSTIENIYSFDVYDNADQKYDMNQLKDKVVLIVNVASKCGFTPQYVGLENLYQKYKDKGFTVLGFPCNQFGAQEPGSAEEIMQFCRLNYGVSFPIMKKVQVNGANAHPLFEYMKKQRPQMMIESIKWNFEKFLVDKQGTVRDRFSSVTKPESLIPDIEKLINE